MATATRPRVRKPKKAKKAKVTRQLPGGGTATIELEADAATDILNEENDPEYEDREEIYPDDDRDRDEVQEVLAAHGAGGSFADAEYRLFRVIQESGQTIFVTNLTAEQAKNPNLIKDQVGGGSYQLHIVINGATAKIVAVNIEGPPKNKPADPITILGGSSEPSGMILLMIESIRAQTAQMQASIELQKAELAAEKERGNKLIEIMLTKKEETKIDELVKLATVFNKNDSGGEALKGMFSFMSESVRHLMSIVTNGADTPGMFFLQQLAPGVKALIEKFTTRPAMVPGLMPAPNPAPVLPDPIPPVPAPAPPPGNGATEPAQTALSAFLPIFEQNILPELMRVAGQRWPDGSYKRDPEAYAEVLESQFESFGDLQSILLEMTRPPGSGPTTDPAAHLAVFLARYPLLRNPDIEPWFIDLWNALMLGPEGRRAADEMAEREEAELTPGDSRAVILD